MSAKPRYRLIVFDWDGTLMDSIATIVACAAQAARDVGGSDPGTSVRSRQAIGLALDETARHILPGASDEVRAAWVERYRHHWFATYRDQPICFDGVGTLLEALAGEGYWLAVATGKSRKGLDRDLEVTGHGKYFLSTRTVNEGPSKPHPGMLIDILGELGVDRREALMVGDTTFDLQMACSAGVDAVAVLTGSHDRDALLACGPVACLSAATELPAWLAGRTG
jgi:phosphoglycolate phosphatase